MSLIVYGAPLSPFVRKLRLYLAEKGLDYQLEVVMPGDRSESFRAISPLGRIPAFRDDSVELADSSVICQYLEDKHAERPPLYGQGAEQRSKVRWLEKYADYELAPLTTFTVFRNRIVKATLGQQCDESAVQSALHDRLPQHFDYLEKTLGQAEYFVGGSLSLADLAIASQLINMEHGGEHLDEQRWPSLSAFLVRIKARPSVLAVLPAEQATVAKMRERAKVEQ
ncbi:glutathione S-transferase family protein [Pseudomonas sp. LS44]|uniref:glutathione S-transferase family protein n=1 Tax=Pseudomonas sp. LS44 TaxID=1357074 RepID=UPI00215B0D8B|nr:glutathione S-transferase family protein [Pseudomonas sp. LS44]UVE16194.1 glutathione S-transferase family protein [Pseudomonas sp. LS44]